MDPLPEVESLAPPPKQTTCSWCEAPATTEIEVRPAQYTTNHHKQKVMKKPPLMAACCGPCKLRIENSIEKAKEEK